MQSNAWLSIQDAMLPEWPHLLTAIGTLVVFWLIALVALWRAKPNDEDTLRQSLRLIPDVLRLVKRLAGDSALPRGVRFRLALLLVYLVSPVDLVPDFIPVVGYADDVLAIALVLRSVVRIAGPEAIDRHWPGTPEGLRTIQKLARASTQ